MTPSPRAAALLLIALAACGDPEGRRAPGGLAVLAMNDGASGWEPFAYRDGTLTRLADVYPGTPHAFPSDFRTLGERVLFCAGSAAGRAPWGTDGTPAGTAALAEGAGDAGCSGLRVAGGRAYFARGAGPWITDGTAGGTRALGPAAAAPHGFTACGAKVCFAASDAEHGEEPWVTDGTAEGTRPLLDLEPGEAGSAPRAFTTAGGLVFFVATTAATGSELWVSDGTAAGTRLVRELGAGSAGSAPRDLVALGARLCFTADDGAAGRELWCSDGTADGTALVKDVWPGPEAGAPRDLALAGDRLVFVAQTEDDGAQLWWSDGTDAGTAQAGVISLGGSWIEHVAGHGRLAVFLADDHDHGPELWTSDGTTGGTRMVADAVAGAEGVEPLPLGLLERDGAAAFLGDPGVILFAGNDGTHGLELWHSDGSARGTAMVADLWAGDAPGLYLPR